MTKDSMNNKYLGQPFPSLGHKSLQSTRKAQQDYTFNYTTRSRKLANNILHNDNVGYIHICNKNIFCVDIK